MPSLKVEITGVPQLLAKLSPDQERFLAIAQDYADTVLRLRSGAQINEQEFARMLGFLASETVRPDTFLARLDLQDNLLTAKMKIQSEGLKGAGFRVPDIAIPSLAPGSPAASGGGGATPAAKTPGQQLKEKFPGQR